jgi:hypothetical protein
MYETQPTQPISLRDTAKGIAVRAGILSVVGLIFGAWVFGLAAKTASFLVKVTVGLLLLMIGGTFAAIEVKRVQRRLHGAFDGEQGSTPASF